jgi:hypothetical protein
MKSKRIIVTVALFVLVITAVSASVAYGSLGNEVLCSHAETHCAAANVQPAGSTLTYVAAPEGGVLEGHFSLDVAPGVPALSCGWATFGAQTKEKENFFLAASMVTNIESDSCTYFGGASSCSSASMNTPPATIIWEEGNSGTVVIGTTVNPLTVSFTCTKPDGKAVSCTFARPKAVNLKVTVSGEENAETVKRAEMKLASGTAGCEPVLELDYTGHSNKRSYIALD